MTMASSSLPQLLLLLAMFFGTAVVGLAVPAEYEYHNYVVAPLLPHPYTASRAADIHGGADSAADDVMMPSTALHIRLVHRDSFVVNSTAAELLAGRLERDERRVAWIISKALAVARRNTTPVARLSGAGGRFVAPVVSGAPTSGEYIAKVAVGTPGVQALLVLDTGSDLTWLQCQPCRHCYPQSGPVFDPRHSTSRHDISHNAPACKALGWSGSGGGGGGGDPQRRKCVYIVAYGDGSTTTGDLISETLTFAGGVRLPDLSIGCGHDNRGLFHAPPAGILGLGGGAMSFPNQIAGLGYNRSFSYCLVDFFSNPGSLSSTLTFGAGGAAATSPPPPATFTPMVGNLKNTDTFYYVRLVGISVGGVRVPGVSARHLRLDPRTGRGGVILDSGTTVTRLARRVYNAFRDAFRAAATDLGKVSTGGPSGFFDTCYSVAGGRRVKVPTVSMHFAGGVKARLPPRNYLIPIDSRGTVCFAFAATGDRSVSIIGNLQQQGFRIVYDIDGQRVGFVPNSC